MTLKTILAAAALATLPVAAQAQDRGDADACRAEVRQIEAGRVGPAGPGRVNPGMQEAQTQEAARLQALALDQAERGDATACWRSLTLIRDLIADNRQQLPTQQDLATGQPGSPGLEEAVKD